MIMRPVSVLIVINAVCSVYLRYGLSCKGQAFTFDAIEPDGRMTTSRIAK
jgi:hypothetical protein